MLADSPRGRDMLGGRPSNCEINLKPVNQAQKPAARKECAAAQFAISWLKSREKGPVMPTTLLICDATAAEVRNENDGIVELTDAELEEMETILAKFPSVDDRYPHDVPKNTSQKAEAEAAEAFGPAPPRFLKDDVAVTGLSVVYEPRDSEPILDIVFIHGLNGHPFKTWTVKVHTHSEHKDKIRPLQRSKASDDDWASTKLKGLFARIGSSRSTSDVSADKGGSGVFWPGDLLPMQCPRARILVFGYNTAIAKHQFTGVVNRNSIFAHSKALVNDLSRTRPLARPVLFVTHSLGGIVIKETLAICSTSNSEEFEDILKSTAGIVFLGTPHRGSPAAGIGEIARKAASVLLMDTNARILDSLSLKNSDLERCQDIFSSLWRKYKFQVKTFQEGLPLKLPIRLGQSKMAKVVPDTSSCLGDPRERAETLDGDHRSICRYAGTHDPNYKKVAAELHAVYSSFLPQTHTAEATEATPIYPPSTRPTHDDQEKLEHFKFREMLLRQLAIGAPADNTCQWLPATASFRIWTERRNVDMHLGLLQITGKPGSGKSTLMKWIFEATRSLSRTSHGTCVVSHFFNRRGQTLEHSARGMLRSILYQLGTLHPVCLGAFKEYTQADLQLLESTFPTSYLSVLKSSLEQILSNRSLAPRRTVIFMDALDECDLSEAAQIGYFFAQLTKSAHRTGVKLDICISRREYPSITVRNCLEISMEAHNAQDIRQYIHQKLELASVAPIEAKPLQETIAQRSNGIFLWVVLAVEGILKDVESGKNAKHVLKRTKSLPKALEDLFAQTLEEMDPGDLRTALRLFQWAVLATGRLRIREWHHILAFLREKPPASLKEWKESDYYTETDAQLERQIRNLSQGLVEVKGGGIDVTDAAGDVGSLLAGAGSLDSTTGDSRVVQPIHETVTEFFMSGRANQLLKQDPGYNFVGEGHLFITSACLDYIGVAEFDELVAARQRQQKSSSSDFEPEECGDDMVGGKMVQKVSLRRRRSATSFMSSASAHSAKYRHQQYEDDERLSDTTYMSTSSSEDLDDMDIDENYMDEIPPLPTYHRDAAHPLIVPCSPEEFAELFPSLTPFTVRHDEFTSDGNMNLRVDMEVTGRRSNIFQLFHLRMYDLSRRDFSLRRYCRDSGREVCCSKLKYVESGSRPMLQRSMTHAIKGLSRRLNSHRSEAGSQEAHPFPSLNRGSTSQQSLDVDTGKTKTQRLQPTNLLRLEFSNYAMVEVDCGDGKDNRRYQFEYWGTGYSWMRTPGSSSFYLVRDGNKSDPIAHIVPETRTPSQVIAEEEAGGWVPPCVMRVTDRAILDNAQDVADVIVATGRIALVDNCIRERWGTRKRTRNRKSADQTNDIEGPVQRFITRRSLELRTPTWAVQDDRAQDPSILKAAEWVASALPRGPMHAEIVLPTLKNYTVHGLKVPAGCKRGPTIGGGDDDTSYYGSAISQTLDEYPALTSYALNRAFEHARAGYALGADPKEVLKKLVLQDRWSRWYVLQEAVTDLETWQDFLASQDLGSWIVLADHIHC
ncbi:hypothetical protein DL770_009885 [Monosporascus sp. CRB-9-2]|nr:hypothetical protein DL770_009885 [Monosporascus sp. CRB-9-2]